MQVFYRLNNCVALNKRDRQALEAFCANRVKEIRESVSSEHWYHCSGENNPADLTLYIHIKQGDTECIHFLQWEGMGMPI